MLSFAFSGRQKTALTLDFVDPLDYDEKCDGSLPLEEMLEPNPHVRQLLMDIDRSKCRVWALTNAYWTVRPFSTLRRSTQYV
jgi:hypothetical protein